MTHKNIIHSLLLFVKLSNIKSTDQLNNWQLSRIRHGCLDSRHTYSAKFTITIRLELYVQLQLFSFSNNQPLYHLQRDRSVQPLLQSGTLLVSTPVQLIHFWHLRTGLKLNCLNLATHNCFWRHRSAPDSLEIWHVGRIRNLFVCMYVPKIENKSMSLITIT